ncbi:hypothetical protein A2U01_0097706, partial [Trifolium medium]|nr:hypothetical protein [Trifolium medium]
HDSDLRPHRRTSRRKFKTPGSRLRRSCTSSGKRSRPETPSKWKIPDNGEENGGVVVGGGCDAVEEICRKREQQP